MGSDERDMPPPPTSDGLGPSASRGNVLRSGKRRVLTSTPLPTVDGYRLRRELGRGGMGVVYLADDLGHDRPVAIKWLGTSVDADLLARFAQEANIGKLLDHPDIIKVLDYGTSRDGSWIVMEYLDGFELTHSMKDDSFGLEDRVKLMVRVCLAVDYAHQRGIIHRDIKPSNVFMTRDGGVRLLDFGIAKLHDAQLTRPGMILGTPRYVAPELTQGAPVDARADVFSLAAVAYEVFTGARPWPQSDPVQLLMAKTGKPPQPFRDQLDPRRFPVDPPAAELLHQIVHRGIVQDPELRYPSALDLAVALEGFLKRTDTVDATGAFRVPDLSAENTAAWGTRQIAWARARAARMLEERDAQEQSSPRRSSAPPPERAPAPTPSSAEPPASTRRASDPVAPPADAAQTAGWSLADEAPPPRAPPRDRSNLVWLVLLLAFVGTFVGLWLSMGR